MTPIPPLETFGRRIMILGLTNSGKSTLSLALGKALDVPVVHLDQLRHIPNSKWVQRPNEKFIALHDEAILMDGWIIEGSYSIVMPQRVARATGIIVLTDRLARRYVRYIRRTVMQRNRAGGLPGGEDHLNWRMLHWLWKTRNAITKYQDVAQKSGLPHLFINSQPELNALYDGWGLTRPLVGRAQAE